MDEAEDEDDYNFGSVSDNDGLESEGDDFVLPLTKDADAADVVSMGMPPFQSELAKLAQVELRTGMPPLQSSLAKQARATVEADEWLQWERQQRGLLPPSLKTEQVDSRHRRTLRRRAARRRADSRRAAVARQEEDEEEEEEFGSVSDNDVDSDEDTAPELADALALGLPPMQSKLGLWAEKMAKADEWMQEQRRARGLPELCLPLTAV